MAQDNLKNLAATSETWGENDKPATAPSAADWGVGDKEYRPDAPARGFKGWALDVAATAVKGAIGVPEAIVGVADIPMGGAVGKFLENEGGAVGFRPKQAKEIVNEWHSDATKEAQRKFQEADGIVDKAAVALQNPSLIATAVGESLPAMGLGGVAARGLMATTRLGQAGAAAAARGATAAEQAAAAQKAATIAGAAGEGLTMAGSAAEQIRQETPDGLLTPEQSGLAAATGLVGGAFGYAGGKLANRLGIGDAETMIAQGSKGMAKQAADDAAVAATNPLVQQAAKSIPRRVVEGAISEGFLEELPQSVAEQIFQNVALGKDWLQDVDAAVVMGVLSGGAMGGAAAGYHGMRQPSANGQNVAQPVQDGAAPVASAPQAEAPPVNTGMERIRQAFADQLAALQQQEQGDPAVPQTAPPDGAAALAQQQAQAEAQRQAAMEASRAVESPDDEIFQSTGAAVPRSVAMGINPAAGPLSAGAALAVDTGVADQVQQSAALAQAAEVALKQGKKTAQDAQKQEQQNIAQQGVNQDAGEIQQPAQMDGWTDSQLSDAFRGAQSRDVRMQLAQELGRRRAQREQQALQAELDAEQQGTVPGADRADGAFATLTEDAGPFDPAVEQPQSTPNTQPNQGWQKTPVPLDGQAQAAIENVAKTPQTNEGAPNGPQVTQAQQDRAQPAQVGAAQTVQGGAPVAQGRAGAQGDQQPATAAGLTDAAPTPANPGAQAAPAAGAQAQAQGSEVEALRQKLRDVEARILAAAPSAMGQGGGDIEAAMTSRKVPVTLKAQRKKLADQIRAAKSEEVQTFASDMRAAPTQQADSGKPLMERAGTSAPTAQGSSLLPRDQSGNEGVPTTSPAAQQAAVHEEPGQAPQTATPSVVGQSIAKAAGNQEASPAQMRNWLFGEIDKAIASAPEVATGFLTFDVPGDGSFKVVNSTAKLQEFRKRVAASPGFRQERGGQPQGVEDGAHKGSASTVEAIKNMLADGDIQAAVEYAGAKGVEFHLVPPQLKVSPNGGKARHIPASVKSTPAGVAEGLTQLESESIHQWLQSEQQRASTTVPSTNNATETVAEGADVQSAGGGFDRRSDGAQRPTSPAPIAPRQETPQKLAQEHAAQAQDAAKIVANSVAEPQRGARAAAPRSSTSTSTRIEDFGETLQGARKMLYAEAYADGMAKAKELDTKAHPLSKTWPEPDYQKLLEGGASLQAVSMVRAMRDAVPTKPQTSWKLTGWAGKVDALRGFAEDILAGRRDAQAVAREMERSKIRSVADKAALYEAVGHDRSLKGVDLSAGRYSMYEGVSYDPPRTIWTVSREAKGSTFGNWPRELAKGDTREQAIAAFKQRAAELLAEEQAPARGASFEIYSKRAGGAREFFIGKKIGRNVAELKAGFADLKAARQYKAEHQAELEDLLAKYKAVPPVRNVQNAPRIGQDYRKGADVTPAQFQETFGFRGVQFGNYVEGSRRQQDLNQAYDGLMDLAGVLNLPPRALSLGGRLGLAFGARGAGGVDAAAAHYERGEVVINLTKKQGAGSLAHEWWHALDNYFSRQRGDAGSYMSEDVRRGDGVREEMRAAFREVVSAIQRTGMQERSRKLDERRTKEYWSTKTEMSARAFESYVIAKLQDQNAGNDYLANVVGDTVFALEGAYPYPTAGEMAPIREAFDGFFRAVETREAEGGTVVLFSRSTHSVTLPLSQRAGLQAVAEEAEQRLAQFVHQPPVVIRESAVGVIPGVRAGDGNAVAGATHGGKIYLFLDQIASRAEARSTLFHELLHYGLRRFLTREQFTEKLLNLYQRDAYLRREADAWVKTADGERAQAFGGADYALARGVDEALATLAEPNQGHYLQTAIGASLVRRVTNWLAELAEWAGFKSVAAELRAIKNQEAREFIQSVFQRLKEDAPATSGDWAFTADDAFSSSSTTAKSFNVDGFLSAMGRSAAITRAGSTTSRAVMDMAREGQSSQNILRLVAGTSKSRFNRQVARLLLRTRAAPSVKFEDADLGGGDGFKFLAKYSRKADAVTLTPGAELQAESIFMHEMIHAATLRALDRKGIASVQMRRLYEHVKKQGGAAGQYGMKNVGEFVAEAFTNPAFQQDLRSMSAPAGGTLKSAWHSFVRILRSILGLPQDGHDALSRALELGVAVMREDMALRQRGRAGHDGDAFARHPGFSAAVDAAVKAGAAGIAGGRTHVEIGTLPQALAVAGVPAGDLKTSAKVLQKVVFDHGVPPSVVKRIPELLEKPVMVFRSATVEGSYVAVTSEMVRGAPLIVAISPEEVTGGIALNFVPSLYPRDDLQAIQRWLNATKPGEQLLTYLDKEQSPAWFGSTRLQLPGEFRTTQGLQGRNIATQADLGNADEAHFGTAELNRVKSSALDQINTAFKHEGKVSLWDKTVGTMRNLAERSPVFKPVYEAAQRFIDDVSMLGNDAADRAPRLLPRVETLADLKKKPITAADNQAVAKPLFEGTLMWARDLDGTPVTTEALNTKYRSTPPSEKAQILLRTGKIQEQMLKVWQGLPVEQFNTIINNKFEINILKPGVVWSAKELSDLFGLNAAQVSLYQEARAAIDRSIDMTARADMLRAMGASYADLREAVLAQATVKDAMTLITDTLQAEARDFPDQADRILSLNNAVVKSYERAKELMDAGYAPLSRFGRYTVDVVGKDGTREYFGMFESIYESNKMKAAMEKAFPGATITQGTMSAEAFKLFQGITPESLEQFGNMLGLSGDGADPKDKAFQAYLQLSKNNHSALKRLIHRKGITGYSEDVGRVLASFVYSNARLAAGGLNAGTLEKAIEGIPKEQGELRDVAMGLRSYIQDPQEEGQAVRGMLFAQYLGGSVASALVNMTQPFQITMPWLSQYGGMRKAAAHLAGALRDMARRNGYEPDLAQALHTAEAEGIVSPQEIHQLMAQARGTGSLRTGDGTKMGDARAAAANNWERVKVAWGQPFALAEQFNRRSTFIAAYRMAKEQGMADPAKFAERAVLETQFVYSKANKPKWARGTIGGTLFTFKTYSVSYLELMHRMWTQGGPEGKRAVGWAVAMLLLVGGAGGLPFMEDAEDLIDGIGQLMGYNVSTKQWRKQALRDVLGKELADFVEQGVSGLPGAPVDVSGRLGMGNLIPGTGLLLSKQNRERDLLEVVGPAGDLISRGFTGARKALTGDLAGAALDVSPAAVRNAAKGIDMATSGIYKDTKGYKVIDTTLDEAIAKAIGFQPKSVAEDSEASAYKQRTKSFYIQQSSEIKAQWADALFRKDDDALERVRARLAAWNRNNPELPIVVKMPDVWKKVREMGKDRAQRIADTAPKALREQMRSMAREAS